MITKELSKIQSISNVAEENIVVESITPTAGKDIVIQSFYAEGGFDPKALVCLVWDKGGNDEEVFWVIRGSGKMPFKKLIAKNRVDGVKNLSLILENTSAINNVYMAGYCKFTERVL